MAIEIQVKKPVIELGVPGSAGGGGGQVQPDWNQNDSTAKDYIKNRPGGYYDDPVEIEGEIYSGELERTEANDTTFITTLRLLNENGTPHDSGFYFCGELDLDSGESYSGPKIEIISGTDDKFASKQSLKTYYR